MSTAGIVYEGGRGAPVRIAPLDPNAALAVTLDVHDWLRGEALAAQLWTPPADLVVGDGVASKLLGTGNSVTPQAPVQFVDPVDGRTKIQAVIWLDDAVTPVLNTDYEITVSLQAATSRGDDRTVITRLRER